MCGSVRRRPEPLRESGARGYAAVADAAAAHGQFDRCDVLCRAGERDEVMFAYPVKATTGRDDYTYVVDAADKSVCGCGSGDAGRSRARIIVSALNASEEARAAGVEVVGA